MATASPTASEPPETEPFEAKITVTLSYEIEVSAASAPKGKKSSAVKKKTKNQSKNKEFKFVLAPDRNTYIRFMNEMLDSHGYSKYGPASVSSRFRFRLQIPPANKSNAIDIKKPSEFITAIDEAAQRSTPPSKLTVFVDLKDIKAASKKRKATGDGESDDSGDGSEQEVQSSDAEKDTNPADEIDRELGRLRGELEDRYRNKHDAGYTFLTDQGDELPLTPYMLKEWSRALYDRTATFTMPPRDNEAFSLAYRGESLPLFPGGPPRQSRQSSSSSSDGLAHVSSIFGSLTSLLGVSLSLHTQLPLSAQLAPPSPAKNTPTKLSRFLKHAETSLGITNASSHLFAMQCEGYGPDILDSVDVPALVALGMNSGDAIRLKRGAAAWWVSPEAKRLKTSAPLSQSTPPPPLPPRIRFEKRWVEGGSATCFGTAIVDGVNMRSDEYTWWYYSQEEERVIKLPDGKVPLLDEEFMSARDGEDPGF